VSIYKLGDDSPVTRLRNQRRARIVRRHRLLVERPEDSSTAGDPDGVEQLPDSLLGEKL
jgi:hypothetical protein